MDKAFEEVFHIHQEKNVSMRTAAGLLSIGRVADAVSLKTTRSFCY